MMAHAKTYVPPDPTAGSSFSSASSGGWAGYVNQSPNNGSVYFNGTWASWTVPTVSGLSEWPSSEYKDAPQVGIWTYIFGKPGVAVKLAAPNAQSKTPEGSSRSQPPDSGRLLADGDHSWSKQVFWLSPFVWGLAKSVVISSRQLPRWPWGSGHSPKGSPPIHGWA